MPSTVGAISTESGRSSHPEGGSHAVPKVRLRHRVSLRLTLIIVCAVALTSALTLYNTFDARRAAIAEYGDNVQRSARLASVAHEQLITSARSTLATLAVTPAIQRGDWSACRALLADMLRLNPSYANVGVIALDGTLVCSALPPSDPVNLADRGYFQLAVATQSFVIGDYQMGSVAHAPTQNLALPVFDATGVVKYVIYVAVDLNWFRQLAGKMALPAGSTIDVFDSRGRVLVVYPDAAGQIGRKVFYADLIGSAEQHGQARTVRAGLDGVRRIYGIVRLTAEPRYENAYLSVGIPVSVVLAPVERSFLRNLALAVTLGLLTVLLALAGATLYVQRPLDALTRAAKRLAAGDLGARAGSASVGGELRSVLETFDDMAASLERRTSALHDAQAHYRALVEQSLVGVSVVDADTFIYVNDALAAIFGYRPDEMIGRLGPINVAHPDDRPLVAENIRRRLEGGGPMHYTFRGLRKDGSGVDVEIFGRSLLYQGRTVVMSTVLDVTAEKQALAQQARRAAEREAFDNLSQRLRAARTPADMYSIVVEQAKTLVGAAFVSLILLSGDRRQLVRVHSSGIPLGGTDQVFPLAGSLSEPVIESGKSRVVDDLLAETIPARWDRSPLNQFGALAVIPVRTEDATIGTILAARLREPGGTSFTEAQLRQLEGVAEIGGIAIRRAELSDSLDHRVQTLTALYGSAQRFAGNLDPGTLAADVVRTCVDLFGMRVASLGCVSADDAALMEAHWPPDSERSRAIDGRAVDYRRLADETCETVREAGVPLIVHDLAGDRDHPVWEATALAAGMRSAGLFPLVSRSKTFAVLALYSDQVGAFTSERVEFLTAYAQQAAATLRSARLFEDADRRLHELEALNDMDRAVRGSFDLRVILHVLLDKAVSELRVDAVDVLLLDAQTQVLSSAASRGFLSDAARQVRVRVGEGHAGQVALTGRPVSVENLNASAESSCGEHIKGERFVSYHATPLLAKGVVKGVLEVFHRAPMTPTQEWLAFFEALAGQTATAIDNVTLVDELRNANTGLQLSYDQTIEGWSRALDLRDRETEGHSQRVTYLTVVLARTMGVSEADLVHVRRGALLHDIGKMGVPDAILLKPGPLTEAEWVVMRGHPVLARELLAPVGYLHPALDIPYSHHEKWDGTGYPQGLSGYEIPLAARVFAVADVWDALRSDRPYRPAWTVEKARAYIREQSGKHFDPQLVEKFLELQDRGGVPDPVAPGVDLSTAAAAEETPPPSTVT